jgi:hypothetical protein
VPTLTRLIRYVPHVVAHPDALPYLPALVVYLYAHAALKLYALFTLQNVRGFPLPPTWLTY